MSEVLRQPTPEETPGSGMRGLVIGFLLLWLSFQVLFPLRHLLYPGSPHWTEEGHRFAWQMKLRDKKAKIHFVVTDPVDGREWRVETSDYLLRHQARKVGGRPDMILQYAHYLERKWRQKGFADVEVRVTACVSLNGRPPELMIDPQRDLAKVARRMTPSDWILPQTVPFERPPHRTHRRDLNC